MLAWLRALLFGESEILNELAMIDRGLQRIEDIVSANQDKIDAIAAQVSTATDDIRGDIQTLKDQIAAGTPAEDLDFSKLDASVASLDELDAENPAASAAPPVDGGDPAAPAV